MAADRPELWRLLDGIQQDLRAAQAKMVAVREMVASRSLAVVEHLPCPSCNASCPGPRTLAEHQYTHHDGPLPDHWRDADARAEA